MLLNKKNKVRNYVATFFNIKKGSQYTSLWQYVSEQGDLCSVLVF